MAPPPRLPASAWTGVIAAVRRRPSTCLERALVLLDYLPDTQNPGPDSETFEHALTESIEEVLGTLKEREAKILRLYFGLDGPEPMTLEEIGSLLGITRERVRQIKEKALSRLRHVSRARALESFLA